MMRHALFVAILMISVTGSVGCQLWHVEPVVWTDEHVRNELNSVRVALKVDGWRANAAWTPQAEFRNRRGNSPNPEYLHWIFRPQSPKVDLNSRDESNTLKTVAALEGQSKKLEAKPQSAMSDAAGKSDPAATSETKPRTIADDKAGPVADAKQPSAAEKPNETPAAPGSSLATQSKENDSVAALPPRTESKPEAVATAWDGFWPLGVESLITQTAAEEGTTGSSVENTNALLERCLTLLARHDDLVGWNAAILWARRNPAGAEAIAPVLERLVVDPPRYNSQTGNRTFASVTPAPSPTDKKSKTKPTDMKAPTSVASDAVANWQKLTGVDAAEAKAAANAPIRQISSAMRLAAAEAWCLVLANVEPEPVDGLAPAGRYLEGTDIPNDVRCELFRGTARWISPSFIPRLENALREGEKQERAPLEIRRAAIEACVVHAVWNNKSAESDVMTFDTTEWPVTAESCRLDPDPQVRAHYVAWLVASHNSAAFDTLKAELHDVDQRVRNSALVSLGELKTEAARLELRAHAERSRDLARAAAVRSLANWGVAEIAHFARDESYLVRRAVAEEVGRYPSVESAILLQDFLLDPNSDVQQAALTASADWSDTLAIPLLLQGMRDSAAETRRECFRHLSRRREIGDTYRFDASREERAHVVAELIQQQNLPASYVDRISETGLRNVAKIDEIHAAEVRAIIASLVTAPTGTPEYQAAVEKLRGLGAQDALMVERIMLEDVRALTAPALRETLAKFSPAHAALTELESSEMAVRRKGAATLAQLGQASSLSPAVLRRIRERLAQEQDRVVWRSMLAAVSRDAGDESAEVALLAVNHSWPDIRTLGCEYIEQHGQPREAIWLMPLLNDSNKTVQLAAVRALGNCHNPIALDGLPADGKSGHRGLRELLSSSDKSLQFAAVCSMSRLGDPQGMQELVRMSYHQSAQTREEAVRQMGQTGQNRFVGHLITLAWTESQDSVRRSILTSLEQLVPDEKRPAGLAQAGGFDAKIKLWAAWWQA